MFGSGSKDGPASRPRRNLVSLFALLAWPALATTNLDCGGGGESPATGGPANRDSGSPDGLPANGPDGQSSSIGKMGVVGDGTCFPLCADASTDPPMIDGWGYENMMSCVVPGSPEASSRRSCIVGSAITTMPGPAPGSPGVVVDTNCYPLCMSVTTSANGDGYGWEFDATCVLPGSRMASGMSCLTGAAVAIPDRTGTAGRLLDEVCTPFCNGAGADPDGDGFGYEFASGCIIKGSAAATRNGIDCTIGEDVLKPPAVLNPSPPAPAVAKPASVASRGFFVAGGKLYDKFGGQFIARGINNPHIWFDVANQYLAYQALDQIARYGANSVRIVWKISGSPSNLARIIRRVVELRMIPMIELHDVTGGSAVVGSGPASPGLLDMAAFLVRPEVKAVLLAYEDFLLVNIANEWSGTDFRNAYQMVISQVRGAGINHTLVIDSNGFGQNSDTLFADGPALLAADPQHNLVFSLHMYDSYSTSTAGRAHITAVLEQARTMALPLMIGEFGKQLGGVTVDTQLIMSESVRLGVGYIPWSWKGNDLSLAYLDMVVDWPGQMLTPWGMEVVTGPNGIMQTARRSGVFSPSP